MPHGGIECFSSTAVWVSGGEQLEHSCACPVRALRVYVNRTASFRGTDQLFVSWATPHKGKPLSRKRLSHWIVDAIASLQVQGPAETDKNGPDGAVERGI